MDYERIQKPQVLALLSLSFLPFPGLGSKRRISLSLLPMGHIWKERTSFHFPLSFLFLFCSSICEIRPLICRSHLPYFSIVSLIFSLWNDQVGRGNRASIGIYYLVINPSVSCDLFFVSFGGDFGVYRAGAADFRLESWGVCCLEWRRRERKRKSLNLLLLWDLSSLRLRIQVFLFILSLSSPFLLF